MAKINREFNVGDRVTFVNNGGYNLGGHQQAGKIVSKHDDKELYRVAIDNYDTLNFRADELLPATPSHNEQFVLTRLFDAEAEIDELQRKVKALEAVLAESSKLTPGGRLKAHLDANASEYFRKFLDKNTLIPVSANDQRKAVIERARAFVADLTTEAGRSLAFEDSRIPFVREYGATIVEFIVNSEKRTVVAIARYKYTGGIAAKGIAKCAPGDVFNADIGKAIALGRALGVDVTEFEQAGQPTEVVVGIVVKKKARSFAGESGVVYSVGDVSYADGKDGLVFNGIKHSVWAYTKDVIIIDDTNAVYE